MRQSGANSTQLFAVRRQLLRLSHYIPISNHSFSAHLLTTSYGSMNGWATVNFVDLQKDGTTFPRGPLTLGQATFMMSISVASCIIGNFVFPHIVRKFGCKRTMYAMGFPQIVGITEQENIMYQ